MALIYTWTVIKNKLTEDLDLINEPFVTDDELLGYVNEAIEESETAVHTFGCEDTYFLGMDFIYLNVNQTAYNLPDNIYADKVRKMFYSNPAQSQVMSATTNTTTTVTVASTTGLAQGMAVFGTGIPQTTKIRSITNSTTLVLSKAATASGVVSLTFVSLQAVYGARRYEVRKIRNLQDTQYFYPGDDYKFLILNLEQEDGGNQIQLYPPPSESGPYIQVLYIRRMRRMTTSTTDANNVCELPECINFIFQHVKWRVAKKRRQADLIAQEFEALQKQYELLQETLREMVPDENNKVQLDLSAYYNQEMDLYY